MWIVRLALRRTYTLVVVALLIAVLGALSIYRMSTDVFPSAAGLTAGETVVVHPGDDLPEGKAVGPVPPGK
jgi:hypothetical protein